MTELQAYVLRSWEKEFPGIGVQRAPDGPRLYRQTDVDQVLRIKQLVFGEGLTVSGARRRLEDSGPPRMSDAEVAEVLSTLGSGAHVKVASVREGLKALEAMLAEKPGEFMLEPPPVKAPRSGGQAGAKPSAAFKDHGQEHQIAADGGKGGARATPAATPAAKRATPSNRVATRKAPDAKRRRASA